MLIGARGVRKARTQGMKRSYRAQAVTHAPSVHV